MNIIKTIIIFFLVLILVNTVQAAVVYGGKLYNGDSFSSSIGEAFTIYGSGVTKMYNNDTELEEYHYKKAIIRSSFDGLVELNNGTCEYTIRYKYCYKESIVDFNSPRAFEDGYLQAAMSITIESLPSNVYTVIITRNQTIPTYCNEEIVIPIIVSNGEIFPTNFTYYEILPANTLISNSVGGKIDKNIITFSGTLRVNETKYYSYTLNILDCESKFWDAQYSFTTYNDTIYKNITDLSILMLPSYNLSESISTNRTNSNLDMINYTLNITNAHETSDLWVNINVIANGMTLQTTGLTTDHNVYKYTGTVYKGSNSTLDLQYTTPTFGNYTLSTIGTISVGTHSTIVNSTYNIVSVPPIVVTYINIDDITNDSITISVISRNDDVFENYYYLYGLLSGMATEEALYANIINPQTSITLATRTYNISNVKENITIAFDGVYRDKTTREYRMFNKKIVSISHTGQVTVVDVAINTTTQIPIVPVSQPTPTPITPIVDNNSAAPVVITPTDTTANWDWLTRVIDGFSKFLKDVFG